VDVARVHDIQLNCRLLKAKNNFAGSDFGTILIKNLIVFTFKPKCPDPAADSSVICLPAGEHVFPFSFQIPKHCPPSFEGNF
jgi:hypothetical protein